MGTSDTVRHNADDAINGVQEIGRPEQAGSSSAESDSRNLQMLPRIHKSSIKNGGSDDDFKSNSRAMYRGVFAVLTLVRSMPS